MTSTYIFKSKCEDDSLEFKPMQTIESEHFGRHFFIDIAFEFLSAPSLKSGGYDESRNLITSATGQIWKELTLASC
tara:strand:- start:277 stop:504 length:228 start_codon:yes stop_codon:yes gene_type:complete